MPSASRAWDLLNGVQLRTHAQPAVAALSSPQYQHIDRNKRPAQDAFGEEKSSDYLQREAFGAVQPTDQPPRDQGLEENNVNGVQDISTRLMAHMLGLEVPGVEPSTSYYPGYEWWPRMNQGMINQGYSQPMGHPQNPAYPGNTEFPPDMQSMHPGGNTGPNWEPQMHAVVPPQDYGLNHGQQLAYNYDFGHYGV